MHLIHDDFLLHSAAARDLYHGFAASEPVFDYHCHLPPELIADNHRFADLFEIWLAGDHYKWRAMRSNGISERLCTGDAQPREKFDAWCATVPMALRNPLYHWSHLELVRILGIDLPINPQNAARIWELGKARLGELRVHDILASNRVAVICTTDDPADSLATHARIRQANGDGGPTPLRTRVYPTFRPDKALAIGDPVAFNRWLEKLGGEARIPIQSFDDLLAALRTRHDDFHAAGCRLSDHGLEAALSDPCTHSQAATTFAAARAGRTVPQSEAERYGAYLMLEFGRWDARRGWTKQLHLGAMRNVCTRLLRRHGPDAGADTIGDRPQALGLARYLDALDATDELPRMVIYNLNPAENYVFGSMIGNFQDGTIPGKIQFGSGWWFLDQKEGIEWQLNALSNLGLLSRFVGMITDSRSFLSYTRHEYFRRVLCNLLGSEMERGELPRDREMIGGMVRNICFGNARAYFNLELDESFANGADAGKGSHPRQADALTVA